MALQYSTALRQQQSVDVETVIGTAPKLQIRTGAPPANCAAADTGALIAELSLPSDWSTQAGGVLSLAGTWSGVATLAGQNVAGHFRLKNNAATATGMQGTISLPGGGGDLIMDNTNIAQGQQIDITTWTITRGNA